MAPGRKLVSPARRRFLKSKSKGKAVMRLANSLRLLLLGASIITGLVVYEDRETQRQGDPDALTSLLPSPVEVMVLSGQRS